MCVSTCCLSHHLRLLCATISVAFGAGFLIYSTYVTNNVQIVGENWLNASYTAVHGESPDHDRLILLWASVIASKEVGKVVGTLIIPWTAEKLGRRCGLLFNNIVTMVGCFLCYIGNSWPYYTIMLGRVLLGVSMICGISLASFFLIEVAPLKYRGASGALIQIFRGLGGTIGMVATLPSLLGTPELWTVALALPAIPALLQFIVLLFCMDSPRHLLITENNADKAAEAIRFYQGDNHVTATLAELRAEKSRIQKQCKVTCFDLLKERDFWRPLLLTIVALTNRSLAGILIVQSYSTDMFIASGISHGVAAYSTVLLGVCHFVSAVLVTFTVEKFGRRPMLIFGNIGCLLTLLLVALCSTNHSTKYLTVGFLALFMLIYPVVASVSNIAASEICHQKIRSFAFTVGLLSYSLVGLLSTFAYPILKKRLGLAFSFIPFCALIAMATLIYIIFLPETRGKTFASLAFSEQRPKLTGMHRKSNGDRKVEQKPLLADDVDMNGNLPSDRHVSVDLVVGEHSDSFDSDSEAVYGQKL